MKSLMVLLLFLYLLPFNLNAEVLSSGANGFTIQIEKEVAVNSIDAYQQFIKVADWWSADHTYFGKSENLFIEPKAGGCFCEIDGDKEVLHMTVSYVEPGKEIRMIGGLGPLQMMGAHGGMSWKFVTAGKNKTKIIHRYQVMGNIEGGFIKLASIVNQVQSIQVESLVAELGKKKN